LDDAVEDGHPAKMAKEEHSDGGGLEGQASSVGARLVIP
jgi:hypothetical protein